MCRGNNKAFTLIELIVVMAIIGILVLLATPKFIKYVKDANVASLQVDTKVLADSALTYYIQSESTQEKDLRYPVNTSQEDPGEIRELIEKYYFKAFGETLQSEDYQALEFRKFDKLKLPKYMKNSKMELDNYLLVIDGVLEGEVFSTKPLENSDGEIFIGLIGVQK